jgi:pimeloyl-ACP methyl ester carboxylesterase
VDLPAYGLSVITSSRNVEPTPEEILLKIVETLGIRKPVVVSPSMSGRFSLPFILAHPEKVGGFIPVAPTLPPRFNGESVRASGFPTLAVWGSNDSAGKERSKVFSSFNGRVENFEMIRSNHACYMDNSDAFHKRLIEFLKSITTD